MGRMTTSQSTGMPTIVFGAFDRHNFGDLLFPHVVAAMLGDRNLIFAGLAERDLRPFGGHQVQGLASLASDWSDRPVTIIHAGGELLACEAWQAAVMLLPPNDAQAVIRHFASRPQEGARWAQQMLGLSSRAPYMVARKMFGAGSRILYNAVGGMDLAARDPALLAEVLERLGEADATGVRDRLTQAVLSDAGIRTQLMPDCAVMVAELFGGRVRSHASTGEVESVMRSRPHGYIAVQFSAGFGDDRTLDIMAAQLDLVTAETGCGVVFFRAGAAPWHDDLSVYERTAHRMRNGTSHVFSSLDIWDICALIADSKAYLGSSLHGRIVAMAYALPRLNLRDPSQASGPTKCSAFADTWEAPSTVAEVGVQDLAHGLIAAMAAPRSVLAHTATRLADDYRRAFAALCERLPQKSRPA